MMLNSNEQTYFDWMRTRIMNGAHRRDNPRTLMMLRQLYFMEFTYSLPGDRLRAVCGVELRGVFNRETGVEVTWDTPCNVLEMMVALAIHIGEDILGELYSDGKTVTWFWLMIDNLGIGDLGEVIDKRVAKGYICGVVEAWLRRDFEPNGVGSPFPLRHPKTDQRRAEIWQQACSYIAENPDLE